MRRVLLLLVLTLFLPRPSLAAKVSREASAFEIYMSAMGDIRSQIEQLNEKGDFTRNDIQEALSKLNVQLTDEFIALEETVWTHEIGAQWEDPEVSPTQLSEYETTSLFLGMLGGFTLYATVYLWNRTPIELAEFVYNNPGSGGIEIFFNLMMAVGAGAVGGTLADRVSGPVRNFIAGVRHTVKRVWRGLKRRLNRRENERQKFLYLVLKPNPPTAIYDRESKSFVLQASLPENHCVLHLLKTN